MYLKSLSVENYRKFKKGDNLLELAFEKENYSQDSEDKKLKVAENTTLLVGRNNSGKTSLINLLEILSVAKTGISKFTVNDFNFNYLQRIFRENLNKTEKNDFEIPKMTFNLEIGVDSPQENSFARLEEILILKVFDEMNEEDDEQGFTFSIDIKHYCSNEEDFRNDVQKIRDNYKEVDNYFSEFIKLKNREEENLKKYQEKFDNSSLETVISKVENEIFEKKEENNENLLSFKNYLKYLENKLFKDFIEAIEKNSFFLSFYPEESDKQSKNFSLSGLMDVKVIKANSIIGDKCLSNAYNKIFSTFIRSQIQENPESNKDILKLLDSMNYSTKDLLDSRYTKNINKVVQEVESSKNLQMNLISIMTIDSILKDAIKYEYIENSNYIPENQFGLGYTHLMVIIAELIDYIEFYKAENYEEKINIICIEEPESYMHPQMQSLFIDNIEKAINKLYKNKNSNENKKSSKINYQLLVSTHSPHILNSKIHTGNTFDNINYLTSMQHENFSSSKIISLSDSGIVGSEGAEKEFLKNNKALTFVKKHMRIETANILFSDAVIVVEGPTEEEYLKYLISKEEDLSKHYISILRISGAHGKIYFNLIQELGIPCILYTDMDFSRNGTDDGDEKILEGIKSKYPQIYKLDSSVISNEYTTNGTLKYTLVKKILEKNPNKHEDITKKSLQEIILEEGFEESLKEYSEEFNSNDVLNMDETKYFRFILNEINVITQGKINDYYATSLEEAIFLENSESVWLQKKLGEIIPIIFNKLKKLHFNGEEDFESRYLPIENYSFYLQKKIDSHKTKFMNDLIFDELTKNRGEKELINTPRYLEVGLEILKDKLN